MNKASITLRKIKNSAVWGIDTNADQLVVDSTGAIRTNSRYGSSLEATAWLRNGKNTTTLRVLNGFVMNAIATFRDGSTAGVGSYGSGSTANTLRMTPSAEWEYVEIILKDRTVGPNGKEVCRKKVPVIREAQEQNRRFTTFNGYQYNADGEYASDIYISDAITVYDARGVEYLIKDKTLFELIPLLDVGHGYVLPQESKYIGRTYRFYVPTAASLFGPFAGLQNLDWQGVQHEVSNIRLTNGYIEMLGIPANAAESSTKWLVTDIDGSYDFGRDNTQTLNVPLGNHFYLPVEASGSIFPTHYKILNYDIESREVTLVVYFYATGADTGWSLVQGTHPIDPVRQTGYTSSTADSSGRYWGAFVLNINLEDEDTKYAIFPS